MAWKKIKLNEEVMSEILVTETTLNQVLRLAILKSLLRRKKKKKDQQQQQQQQQQHHHNHHHHHHHHLSRNRNTGCSEWQLPTWGPPHGRNTNIHPFVGPAKGVKKREAPHTSTKTAHQCLC